MNMFMNLDRDGFDLLITDEGWAKLLELDAEDAGDEIISQGVEYGLLG